MNNVPKHLLTLPKCHQWVREVRPMSQSQMDKFVYRVAQKDDKELLVNFLFAHFTKEEPCARALKMTPDMVRNVYSSTVERCLQFPFSTIVTSSDGQTAACLLNSVWNRSDPAEGADYVPNETVQIPERIQLFLEFLNSAHENFWSLAPPHVNAVIHRELGSVAKPFVRRGIATRLITENLSKSNLRKYNIGGVISETSSLANQILLAKNGFKCLKEMPYSSIVDSNGNEVLRTDDGTTALRLNYRAIEDYENLPE